MEYQLPAGVGAAKYWVDGDNGDDSNAGTSPAAAWRSLERANAGVYRSGDQLLLRAGCVFKGQLAPRGEGAASRPFVIGSYGQGPRPVIHGEGKVRAAVHLRNCPYTELTGLELTNRGPSRAPARWGVLVELEDFGACAGVVLRDLDIHDVNGGLKKRDDAGCGIYVVNRGDVTPSWFEGLLIERCRLARTDRNGIITWGYCLRSNWRPNRNVVIRDNQLKDIGGDGIVVTCSDGVLVERNVLQGGRRRCKDYAAGMWPWSCDNCVFQYNEVSGMKGVLDGQAFDSDWNCTNVLFQYNYSHDNDGGFMLVCNDGSRDASRNAGNVNTVVRYNVSLNDGRNRRGDGKAKAVGRLIQIGGPCRQTHFYNNTFIVHRGRATTLLFNDWNGWSHDTCFSDNLFVVEGTLDLERGQATKILFQRNAFCGRVAFSALDAERVIGGPAVYRVQLESARSLVAGLRTTSNPSSVPVLFTTPPSATTGIL